MAIEIAEHIKHEFRYPINSKQDMRELLKAGAFGNNFRKWASLDEVKESGYKGRFWISQSAKPAGLVDMNIPVGQLKERYEAFVRNMGLPPDQVSKLVQINEAPPKQWVEFHAEVQSRPDGLYVRYSRRKTNMRDAFTGKRTKHLKGLDATMFLHQNLDPDDYEDLQTLLTLYQEGKVKYGPGHIIEIHKFKHPVGTLQRKMVIGEVRNY